jgi:hypothetical protein
MRTQHNGSCGRNYVLNSLGLQPPKDRDSGNNLEIAGRQFGSHAKTSIITASLKVPNNPAALIRINICSGMSDFNAAVHTISGTS